MSGKIRFAVIGWPVAHSRSPQMQNAALRALGINGEYTALEVAPGQLPEAVARMRSEGYAGWNVTVPHKEEIIPLLDEVAGEEARAARSVNTVLNRNGRLLGYSTDGYGVEMALKKEFGFRIMPERQLYIGTGGAAKAAAVYAARHGAGHIVLANRTPENAEKLAAIIRVAAPQCRVEVITLAPDEKMRRTLEMVDILFQCTSLGLHAGDPEPIPAEIVPCRLPVYDFVYTPSAFRTKLTAQGNPVADGTEMLVQQGAKSMEIWTGIMPSAEIMRTALKNGG
ncbi:MAG: shikimate dehydrogenase [Victivallales bacterium]|nr:shikimate dehydrogenase [Victivallales bacterium]